MKNKELTRNVVELVAVAIVTATLCTGCNAIPTHAGPTQQQIALYFYSNPDLPRDQVAVLNLGGSFSAVFAKDAVSAVGVDGKQTLQPDDSIKLLPGHHTIRFIPNPYSGFSPTPINKDVYVEAGKTYRAKIVASGMHFVSEQRFGSEIITHSEGYWSVEVTEE